MRQRPRKTIGDFAHAVKSIFSFSFFLNRKTRKTRAFLVISFLPVLMSLIIKVNTWATGRQSAPGISLFTNIIMIFYLQFLILILALFYGSSICSEELEGKTLTYLTTRPVSKSAIVLGKYAAYMLLAIGMVVVAVTLSFLILNIERLPSLRLFRILARDLGVLALGLISYGAFFTFIGMVIKRSIFFGLLFSFGWENVLQYFPGSTQRLAIAHYLKSLLPPRATGGRFSFLLFRLEPSSHGVAILMLCLLTVAFLVLACVAFSQKEYILED
jgi:ABC-type transport system involved in multi-copper enzyme maturation permease subunit